MTIYNAIRPPTPLHIDEKTNPTKRPKVAAFKFVEACLKGELEVQPGDCFALTDLFGDDTTGFVKVGGFSLVSRDGAMSGSDAHPLL
jgi:cell division control protein 24